MSITDTISSTRNQAYAYDLLNRIASGAQSDNSFNITYAYDAWGNMKESGTSNLQQLFDVKNRLTPSGSCSPNLIPFCYDAAGNLLMDNHNHLYAYDAESRIKTVDSTVAAYFYGADGSRARKTANGVSTEYIYFAGNVIAEKDVSTGAWTDYIFGYGGKRLAKDTSLNSSAAQYYHGDHLGTARLMTDNAGNKILDCTFNPFGEQVSCSPDNASNRYRFTGKERDTETGLDYFGARYYSSGLGRFGIPDFSEEDPFPLPGAEFSNPQGLNLYSFVANSPLVNVDPDGHDCVVQTRTGEKTEQVSVSSGNCDNVKVGEGQSKTYVPGTTDVSRIHAGADGKSIDIGYTPYDGGGYGVQNANSAPIPGNINLAPGWGDNAQGYRTLTQASITTDRIGWATLAVSGANVVAIAGSAVAGTSLTTIGQSGPLVPLLPPLGAKISQIANRMGVSWNQVVATAEQVRGAATQAGTYVNAGVGWIYRVGNTYLVTNAGGRITSFVPNATAGVGIVNEYYSHGGR